MNTYKKEIISTLSLAFVAIVIWLMPAFITYLTVGMGVMFITFYKLADIYIIDYKYCLSFVAQLGVLIVVTVSLIVGFFFVVNSY